MPVTCRKSTHFRRRGAVAALTAVGGTVLIGFVALTVDIGVLYNVKAELQRTADAAAMAGAWEMLIARQKGASQDDILQAARDGALNVAGMNLVQSRQLEVDENSGNHEDGDVVLGYLEDPTDLDAPLDTRDPSRFNTVRVRVHRTAVRNGPVDLFFAGIFGVQSTSVQATAAATFRDGVVGFSIDETRNTSNVLLLPMALHVDIWEGLMAGTTTTGDQFTYDPDTKQVTAGADGTLELNVYPGAAAGQLPPGSFGTVNIGTSNNSTATLSRQIREGINAQDLAHHGGELALGPDGSLTLTGESDVELSANPGVSAAIDSDLASIKGQTRIILLFDYVTGTGNTTTFRIVGFAGIRIMEVGLTGAMDQKRVIVQPAHVMDENAIAESGSSYLVYEPVYLSR